MIIEVLIRNEIIVELINDLNSDYKKVIVLRYYKDLPIKEIARRYDLSESVVSKRLARARKNIAKLYLKKWEGTSIEKL